MISFTSLLQTQPLVLKESPDPETEYTQVQFENVVVNALNPRDEETEVTQNITAPALMFRDSRGREISIVVRKDDAWPFVDVLEKHPDRAMVYEILVALFRKLDIQVIGTFVHDVTDYRFLAKLRLKMAQDGQVVELACRPSDGTLVSLLSDSPIYVKNALMDEFSIDMTEILGQR